jgi:hypothetical protein
MRKSCLLVISKEKEIFKIMTSRDFCYWLQGFFEVSGATILTASQTEAVKNHLSMVFKHEIDPSMGNQEHQNALNHLHNQNPDGPTVRC